ncbi:TPA: pyridoxine/pyridoxamine 5'-phosphate oxidase [Legionella pneumophila]
MPLEQLKNWIEEEKKQGAPNPQQAVLSTVSQDAKPHSRVVAIREISAVGLIFFTQLGTRKVSEMAENPFITLTFWFELMQRQVIIEALVEPLTEAENRLYWTTYPRNAQLRFLAYAPTSGQPIASKELLEAKKNQLEQVHGQDEIPYTPLYRGYCQRQLKSDPL